MAAPKGHPQYGGRKKGVPNKATAEIRAALASDEHDPFEGMRRIARNMQPCGVCRGTGITRFKLPQERPCDRCKPGLSRSACVWCSGTGTQTISERTCMSCYGTLFEHCSPELIGKMNAELAQYVAPKLKAVEHSGKNGGAIQVEILEKLQAGRLRVAALSR